MLTGTEVFFEMCVPICPLIASGTNTAALFSGGSFFAICGSSANGGARVVLMTLFLSDCASRSAITVSSDREGGARTDQKDNHGVMLKRV